MVGDKAKVKVVALHEQMAKAMEQGQIRTGSNRQVPVRSCGSGGAPGIHHHQAKTFWVPALALK